MPIEIVHNTVLADERAISVKRNETAQSNPCFFVYNEAFRDILGNDPALELIFEEQNTLFHEAGVYDPDTETVFVTSNPFVPDGDDDAIIQINILSRKGSVWIRETVKTDLPMANGGINYRRSCDNGQHEESGVLFCAQGNLTARGGLVYMSSKFPYATETILDSYYGRQFNSLNDVVTKSDGTIWFTDPIYGSEQKFRPKPQLPNQVYRFDRETGDVRAVADGFGRPNGLCFSPDEETLYVTDTDWIHGDGTTDDTRASNIYAFDVIKRSGADFLANRRLFAMADVGIPDGIKCDTAGNVYSGCGDGLSVWNAGGTLLGKIVVPGGIANFCFGRDGEIFLLNETRFWIARIEATTSGALLAGLGIRAAAS